MSWADQKLAQGRRSADPLPVNYEVESALLAALLRDNATFESVAPFLEPDHFAEPVHGVIYRAIAERCLAREHVDAAVLANYFDQTPALEEVGGGAYLADLQRSAISVFPNAVRDWGRVLHRLAVRRQLIENCEETAGKLRRFAEDEDLPEIVEAHEHRLLEATAGAAAAEASGPRVLGDILKQDVMPEIERRAKHEGALTGLTTGFAALDELTGGLEAPEVVVLAGRPSMGKTTLLTNMATRMAASGRASLIFSLEMGQGALITRMVAERTSIPFTALQRGSRYDMADQLALGDAGKALADTPIYVDDRPGLTVLQMHASARQLQRQKAIDCIFVDHIGYVTPPNPKAPDWKQPGDVMKELRRVAKDLGVPVLVLCQLNRANTQRDDKRPHLSDLRASGQIEEDADQVWFIHREAYYLERSKPRKDADVAEWAADLEAEKNRAEVIVAKQRNGPIGSVRLFFDANRMRVDDLTEDDF